MAEIQTGDITMEPDALYREETITDRRVGTIRKLVPITEDGSEDGTRDAVFVGQAQIMTPMGAIPLAFELDARTLKEAISQFPQAAKEAVEKTAKELDELRREAASSIVLPGSGGVPPGGGLPGAGGLPGGGIQMP